MQTHTRPCTNPKSLARSCTNPKSHARPCTNSKSHTKQCTIPKSHTKQCINPKRHTRQCTKPNSNLREFCRKLPSSCSPVWGTMGPFCWDLLRFRWIEWIRWRVPKGHRWLKTKYTGPCVPENGHQPWKSMVNYGTPWKSMTFPIFWLFHNLLTGF